MSCSIAVINVFSVCPVIDSLSLDYNRGDVSSYQHEFTKNIIGNLTGNADTATKLATPEIETLRRSANFTLGTYADGKKLRIANTHATDTITCTLPTGQTMNGQTSFTIAPDTILEFELIGTAWKCVSKEWEYVGAYSSGVVNINIAQYKAVKIDITRDSTWIVATSSAEIQKILSLTDKQLYSHYYYDASYNMRASVKFNSAKTITEISDISNGYVFSGLYLYGMK